MLKRDIQRIERIRDYCGNIRVTIDCMGGFDQYTSNFIYRNAACMCLLQIGEIANGLSEDFLKKIT